MIDRYRGLADAEKLAFFRFVNDELDIDAKSLAASATDYTKGQTPEDFVALSKAAEPKRQELLRRRNQPMCATASIAAMRGDLRGGLKVNPELARTDHYFAH